MSLPAYAGVLGGNFGQLGLSQARSLRMRSDESQSQDAAAEMIGPRGVVVAVLRQAVKDARAGTIEAAAWLQTWGELWARAAGLDQVYAWADVLHAQGIRHTGRDYMPERDHPDVTALQPDQSTHTGRPRTRPAPARIGVKLVVANDKATRAVMADLRQALAACDGDLSAALGELRGTPAGDRLLTWLAGES